MTYQQGKSANPGPISVISRDGTIGICVSLGQIKKF